MRHTFAAAICSAIVCSFAAASLSLVAPRRPPHHCRHLGEVPAFTVYLRLLN